jgi:NADP-dependent 3-hydroxy acid dehydrogenase YdfG/acyl carrier protein
MLALSMELEADLGIDSIKRVEILSAMRERAPGLPEVNATEMAALRTLGQIVDYMRGRTAAASNTAAAAPGSAVAAPRASAIERFVVVEESAPAAGLVMPGLFAAARVAVTDDGAGVAAAVARALSARGVPATVVATVPADADAVVFLGGLRAVANVDDAVAVNREAFDAARAVAARFAAQGGLFVTVQDTGGVFGLSGREATRAWTAGVSALARTAAVEWPTASVKAIDLARDGRDAEALAAAIVAELFTGGATREVGLHADGARTTLRSVAREVTPAAMEVDPNAVVVVSGGGRGVTAASAVALAGRTRVRVVLLGRSRLEDEPAACAGIHDDAGLKRALLDGAKREGRAATPAEVGAQVAKVLANREVRATLDAIRAAGSEVRYVAVDVADGAKLGAALDEVRAAWGPITGVVHGAGVLADKLIAEKTPEQFDRVFDTKVAGLRSLLAATAGDPLRWMVLFSSVAARTGNTGQCDYAMANEVLNKVAAAERRRRAPGFVAKAIGWGPWEGGMVTPALKARFDQMGVALIPLAEGARRFVDEIAAAPDEVETVVGGAMGDGPLGARVAAGPMSVELSVDQGSHPYLSDHRVAGKPVVPVALAIEWMARAARVFRPGAGPVALRDLKVLRGIKLDHFENGGHRFALHAVARPGAGPDDLTIELRGKDNVLHFTATVETRAGERRPPERAADPRIGAWTREAVYDGHLLFHGPSFQVIQSIDGVSKEGIIGTLTGTHERAWRPEAWRVDPAALDGALQFALLWSREVLGGASLPMAVAAFESYAEALPEGVIRCVVRGREVHESRAVCDVLLEDAAGRPLAAFRGVETILRPGEAVVREGAPAGVPS